MSTDLKVKIKKLSVDAKVPSYAKHGDAGLDLCATSVKETPLYIEYGTSLAFEIPEGHVGLLFPRSSVTNKDLIMKNSVGVIDSSYRGEVTVRFYTPKNNSSYQVGDRIAQLVVMPFPKVSFEEVDVLSSTDRGDGGYGSTGVR
jgi:dUTP pyrophosphatase